jgi:hypothetical protein
MKRIMTTIYVEPQQLKGLRKAVFEIKEQIPTATQSDLIRVAVDSLLQSWRKTEQREGIVKAVRLQK